MYASVSMWRSEDNAESCLSAMSVTGIGPKLLGMIARTFIHGAITLSPYFFMYN